MTIPIRASSLVRALGPAVAAAMPATTPSRTVLRATVLAVTDLAARRMDPRGISLVMVTPDDEARRTRRSSSSAADAVTTGSWVGVCLLKGLATDRLPIPRGITVVATGVAVYVLDDVSAKLHDDLIRKAAEAKQKAGDAEQQAADSKQPSVS